MRPVPPAAACTRIKSPALTGYTCRISTCAVIPCGPGTFEARDKGKRLRVVSGAVIHVNVVEACRRLAQAHLTRPGLTDIDRCPVPRDRPSAEFGSHEAYGFPQKHEFPNIPMQDGKFRHFIIITIIVPFAHDSVIRRENALGDPLARRFTRPRRVRPCRVHRRCSRSSIPDALCDYPASATAGGCVGCRVARPLGKASASELAWLQGARTSARSATADGGAEISCLERR